MNAVFRDDKVTFVIPVKNSTYNNTSDLDRLTCILLPSIEINFELNDIEEVIVVCPAEEVENTQLVCGEWPFKLVVSAESEMLQHLPNIGGWQLQQVVKLCAARFVKTATYITLDSDCFVNSKTSLSHLVVGGKLAIWTESAKVHRNWCFGSYLALMTPRLLSNLVRTLTSSQKVRNGSARILWHRSEQVMAVTPQHLRTTTVLSLLDYFEKRYSTCFERGVERMPEGWTEYQLYWLFVRRRDLSGEYFHLDRFLIAAWRNTWMDEDEALSQLPTFFAKKDAHFGLIQSYIGLDAKKTAQLLELSKA